MQTKANGPAVSGEQVRRYRLAAHHLDRPLPPGSLTEAAGVCGVQNSPPGAWETALFARVAACTPALLRQALEEEKTLLQAWSFRGVPAVFPAAESSVFLSALAARPGEEPWIYTRGVTLALDFLGMEWDQALALVRQAASCLDGCTVQSKEELDRLLAEQAARTLPPQLREKWNAPSMYGRPDRQTVGGAVVSFALRPCSFLGLVVFGARQGPPPCVRLLPPVVRAPAAAGSGGGAPPGGKIPARLRSGHPGGSRRLAGVQPQTGRAAVANGPGTDAPGREGGPRSLDAGSGPAAPAASRAALAAAGTPGPP